MTQENPISQIAQLLKDSQPGDINTEKPYHPILSPVEKDIFDLVGVFLRSESNKDLRAKTPLIIRNTLINLLQGQGVVIEENPPLEKKGFTDRTLKLLADAVSKIKRPKTVIIRPPRPSGE
jgi:hypothetical protein